MIYGAGGLGRETADILTIGMLSNKHPHYEICFIDDLKSQSEIDGHKVFSLQDCPIGTRFTVGVGEPEVRKTLFEKSLAAGLVPSSVIAHNAFISNTASIGPGSIIAPFCSIQSSAVVGENVSVNTMAIIGHDVLVEKNSVISSMVNLGGNCVVSEETYIGMGALVKEDLKIGKNSIIGMGSVVYQNIPDGVIALGNPARVAKKNIDKKVFGKKGTN